MGGLLRRAIRATAVAGALLGGACSATRVSPPVPTGPSYQARLEAADTLVRAGCLDCLAAAHREYRALRADHPDLDKAIAGEVRAAALIDIRERELGLLSSGSLMSAREAATGSTAARLSFSNVLDVVAELRLGPDGARPSTDEQRRREADDEGDGGDDPVDELEMHGGRLYNTSGGSGVPLADASWRTIPAVRHHAGCHG